MMEPGVLLEGGTALVAVAFGLLILRGGPRETPNLYLGFFLLLVAGNLGAEILRTPNLYTPTGDTWFRVATVFASLDPLMLYMFVSVFPRRNALNRAWAVGLVAAVSAVLALGSVAVAWPRGAPPRWSYTWLHAIARDLFTVAVYSVGLVHLFRTGVRDDAAKAGGFLIAGLSVAVLPKWPQAPKALAALLTGTPPHAFPPLVQAGFLAAMVVPLVAAWTVVYRGLWGSLPLRGPAWGVALAGTTVAVLLAVPTKLGLLWRVAGGTSGVPWPLSSVDPFTATTLVRWTLFSVFVSMAVLRHQVLGMSIRVRRLAARTLVGLVALGGLGVVVVGALEMGQTLALRPFDVLVVGLILIASQGFQGLVDRVAERVYGVPMPGDRAARLEAYSKAVDQVASEGRDAADDPELAELRDELGLDERSVSVLHRMAEPATGGPLKPGAVVQGRYKVARLLGTGGMARVFLARDELLERDVVLKEVETGDARTRDQAIEEARLAGGLNHPNVVTVYDVLDHGNETVLLVTEHVPGGSLKQRIEKEGPLEKDAAFSLVDGVLNGLEAVHEQGIVHQDLKPANVLLATDGTPKIADFGIARARTGATETFQEAELRQGTPKFMAPEQRRGEVADERSDLYAVGRLIETCVAEPLPDGIGRTKEVALAADPDDRWTSAERMRKALGWVV